MQMPLEYMLQAIKGLLIPHLRSQTSPAAPLQVPHFTAQNRSQSLRDGRPLLRWLKGVCWDLTCSLQEQLSLDLAMRGDNCKRGKVANVLVIVYILRDLQPHGCGWRSEVEILWKRCLLLLISAATALIVLCTVKTWLQGLTYLATIAVTLFKKSLLVGRLREGSTFGHAYCSKIKSTEKDSQQLALFSP